VLTPFGIAIRKLRLDKGMRLLDLARQLGLSSAQVSAVEIGSRAIQPGYVEQVIAAMNLTAEQAEELQRAADQTRGEVKVDHLPMNQRELVAAFARKVDALPPDFMEQLRKQILKAVEGETPFRRKRRGALVAAQSTANLRSFAEQVRGVFVTPDRIDFPIMDILEFHLGAIFPGFAVVPCSHSEMGDDEGRVIPGFDAIFLREDVYEGAWDGIGRFRFTACHELAHYLLHRNVGFARTRDDHEPMYRDAEWQADTFAGALMMSAQHVPAFVSVDDAAAKCGMTPHAARVMLSKYGVQNM
jgi:Zn-dependent peptidase ImmA (M78 family)/transcriptional regulator with XRE-family HTH domain